MSRTTYQAYKPSSVDWLGGLPETWEIAPVRRLFDIKKRIAGTVGFSVLSITQRGIKVKDTESNEGQLSQDYSKYQLVEPGDFAMNHMDLLTGYVDISTVTGVTSPDYRVFSARSASALYGRYYLYLFQFCYTGKIFYSLGQGSSHLGRWRLPADQFNSFAVPVPSIREQQAIASFLDRETSKLDTLIEKQERLIELLQEKRQAVISGAVTKGLDPEAAMKNSGAEWLGAVPARWDVATLSRLTTKVGDGLHGTPQYVDESTIHFINGNNLVNGEVLVTESTRAVSQSELDKQDIALDLTTVLLSINGTIGNLALYRGESVMLGKSAAYIKCGPRLNREYLFWFLQSSAMERYFEYSATGTTILNLSLQSVRRIPIALPSPEEQAEIIDYLWQKTATYERLIRQARHAIELQYEHRCALIFSAVTGKIDVRDSSGTSQGTSLVAA